MSSEDLKALFEERRKVTMDSKEIYQITEKIMERWRKFDTPRYQDNLSYGKEVIKQTFEHYFALLNENVHPNAIERILARALELSPKNPNEVFDKVFQQWCQRKDKDWTFRPRSLFFVTDVKWFLDNSKALGHDFGRLEKSEKRERVKREYPIEEIKKLHAKGKSVREIAKQLQISKSTIQRILSKP